MNAYKMAMELIIGSRLKRLSDKFLSDVSMVYRSDGIPFETAYFPVFFLLRHHGTLKVSDVARELAISQSGASQMVNALVKKGLITCNSDSEDKRIRTLSFTSEGSALLSAVLPVWDTIRASFRELLDEGENSRYFLQALDEIEMAISRNNLYSRAIEKLEKKRILTKVLFLPLDPSMEEAFRELALPWLIDNSFAAEGDTDFINRPHHMVRTGRAVATLARTQNEAIGCFYAAVDEGAVDEGAAAQISVFAVKEPWRGHGLAEALLQRLLLSLKESGVKTVSVIIDRKLSPSINTFKEAGFSLGSLVRGEGNETGFLLTRAL